jgi:sugar/nucleoside kinase (ribokinase family)
MTYLDDPGIPDAFEIALRYDVLVGNRRELLALTGQPTLDSAIAHVQSAMPGANLRAGVITQGADGSTAFIRSERWDATAFPIDVVDTTGAGDAFAGAVAYAMALRWDWPVVIRFANAVAGLSTRSLGAQTALPTWDEVTHLLDQAETSLL